MFVDSGRLLVHIRLGTRPERARRAGVVSARVSVPEVPVWPLANSRLPIT